MSSDAAMPTKENSLVQAMLKPEFYSHPVEQLRLIETHISWVFLTGEFAYKVKKPVNFGFLDFSRLERRKFYCEEELRLNSRLAADIYLSVIPISKVHETFRLGDASGNGEVVEYAVCMKQFSQHCLLENLLEQKQINLQHMEQLADQLAAFHQHIAVAGDNIIYGNSDQVIKPVEQNFTILGSILTEPADLQKLHTIEQAALEIFTQVTGTLKKRKQQGFIRECHGDMHVGNIALVDERILIFDGIEFNDSFKWIDTMSELAFLVMDLQDHGEPAFASHLLNRYLQNTGDYEGLKVLRFYLLYRAMVRAKVAGLRLQQQQQDSDARTDDMRELYNYLDLALGYINPREPFIAITHGLSGSGKSWISEQLSELTDAIIIRSDRERKRLYANHENLYTDDITQHTYQHLFDLCTDISKAGYPVFVDATFLHSRWRNKFLKLAEGLGRRFYILRCHADVDVLESRIRRRAEQRNNISDADVEVLHKQMETQSALDADERDYCIDIDTGAQLDMDALAEQLLSRRSGCGCA